MDLNELKKNVLASAEQCKNMRAEKKELKEQIAENARINIEKIVLPELKATQSFCHALHDIQCTGFEDEYETLKVFPCNWGCSGELIYNVSQTGISCYLQVKQYTYELISDKLYEISDLFDTEEKCFKFVDKIHNDFAAVLNSYQEKFSEVNEELANDISKLKERLNNSHAVEEKEDGSIEITLNGRTYIGTIKEK